jgi:hypothetical protein
MGHESHEVIRGLQVWPEMVKIKVSWEANLKIPIASVRLVAFE